MSYRPTISPSQLGEYIHHGSCPKFAKLNQLFQSDANDFGDNWDGEESFNPLNQLLAEQGDSFEEYIYDKIVEEYDVNRVMPAEDWHGTDPTNRYDSENVNRNYNLLLEYIREAAIANSSRDKIMLLEQIPFKGEIESFDVNGDADMMLIEPLPHNGVRIRIFDIKASWDEKTYHRVQTAAYTLLLRWLLRGNEFDEEIDYQIEGGIIHRETDIPAQLDLDDLPSFDVRPVEDDVQRLLQSDGELYEALQTEESEIDYQLSDSWRSGPFTEYGIVESVEDAHIRLLEVSRGEQRVLRKHGFETLYDIADIIPVPESPRPYQYDMPAIKDAYEDAVLNLQESGALNESVVHLAQRAQSMLNKIDPDHPNAYDYKWENQQWKIGSGQGQLPDDDPRYELDNMQNGSMIRVYLNVQVDHIRNTVVMLSAQVDCSLYDGDPLTVSKIVDDIPNEPPYDIEDSSSPTRRQEKDLLKRFLEELTSSIKYMSELTGQQNSAPLHFYFYEQNERTSLIDTLRRNDFPLADNYRDLLSMKEGVDQKMVSFIEPEIEQRFARNEFSTGLVQQYRNIFPFEEKEKVLQKHWTIVDADGEEHSLQRIFSHKLFNTSSQYYQKDVGIDPFVTEDDTDPFTGRGEPDGWYPVRPRFGAQIPLEYIWGCEGIDAFDDSGAKDPMFKYVIKRFLYYGDKNNQKRITKDLVKQLGLMFAKTVEHIERGISYKNADIEKQPLNLSELESFSLGESTLRQGLMEYLDLEYITHRREVMSLYKTPLKKRVVQGNAVPFRVTGIEEDGSVLNVEGELLYDEFDFLSPDRISGSARIQGSGESSGGSRRIATPIEDTDSGWAEEVDKPEDMQHSPVASVETFDPSNNKIALKFFPNGGSPNDRYQTWHKGASADGSYGYMFGIDSTFVLDEQSDDMTAERTRKSLLHAPDNNMLYYYLSKMSKNSRVDTSTDVAKQTHIETFIDWLDENYFPSPNDKQESFIKDVSSKFHLLQGPPGTGKTSGATSLAILARAFARGEDGNPLRAMVTGASNKAIDEVMEDVHDALVEYQEKTTGQTPLDNVQLVRLTGNPPSNQLEQVEYTALYDNEDEIERLYRNHLENAGSRQSTLGETSGGSPTHTIIFTTPSTFYKFAQYHPDVLAYNQGVDAADRMDGFEQYRSLFDLLCVDEASMLSMPQLAMAGAFTSEEAQIILSGDQRQMPPVQQYEWLDEDRRTIEEVVPFLSSLDFFRLLRGDDLEQLSEEHWDALPSNYNADIPITRLQTTYRCHSDVADFLRRWVYQQDGINYRSDQTYTISPTTTDNTAVQNILDKDTPITLILHEDASSRQSNRVEAKMAREIIEAIPPSETTGVVTPHNAQKGLLNTMTDRAQVDTVERFQGGQRDVMVVSATVSDPDFLAAESDFILNPNRLNVALSRMKKKLVVIAPKTLFTLLPEDTDEYEDSIIWKGLYKEVDVANSEPRWKGVVENITEEDEELEDNVRVEVYSN